MRKVVAFILLLAMIIPEVCADITGTWRTVDDETGEAKSIVEIEARDGHYFGRVQDLLLKPDDTICEECEGALKDQRVLGMEIITGLTKAGDEYTGGEILDPETGKVYRAKLWLENENTLKVRGYLGIFFRTQTWYRAE